MINICNNCTVNLTNITIDLYISRNCLIEKCSKGIKVSNKSTLNIKPGTTIKNNNISTKKDSGIKSAICSDNSKIINCTSKNESTGKGNAIYTDYNVKLTIGNKCAIRFDDKCKINTNKDNSEQEYKHKGIFDKKIFLKLY